MLGGRAATEQLKVLRAEAAKTPVRPVERPVSEAEVDYEMLLEQRAEERAFDRRGGAA